MDEARRELLHSWLTKAANDLKGARILGADPEGPLDTAIYHCQQAGEKAVKAFLVFRGITPAKTHDIRRLAVEASALEPAFDQIIAPAAALTPYAWEFRYPDDLSETYPTREEFNEALEHARTIYDFVVNLLPTEARL
jgi:HEPN domain-containing protein